MDEDGAAGTGAGTGADTAVVEPEVEIAAGTGAEGSAGTETDAGATAGQPAAGQTPKPSPDWREARIAKLSAQLREARDKLGAQGASPPPAPDEATLERIIEERASAKAAQEAFNAACNSTAAEGRKQYQDFDARVGALTQLVDRNDQSSVQQYNHFLQTALETGAAAELIHRLGGDLNEAQRLMSLSPVKMAVELTKLASRPGPAVSAAPKPITPIGQRGASLDSVDPTDASRADKLSTREWMERRERQLAAKTARR